MKNVIRIGIALTAISLVVTMTACSQQAVLTVGVDENQAPFSFRDESGNWTGFQVDMATEAARRAGMSIKFQPVDWDNVHKALQNKKVNAVWGVPTEQKDTNDDMLYTKPYLSSRQVLLTTSASDIKGLSGLTGKAVGVLKDSPALDALDKTGLTSQLEGGQPNQYDNIVTEKLALDAGQLDAVAIDEASAEYYVSQNTNDYKILLDTLSQVKYAVGVRRNDSGLRNSLQKALTSMASDGTSTRIAKKWFNTDLIVR